MHEDGWDPSPYRRFFDSVTQSGCVVMSTFQRDESDLLSFSTCIAEAYGSSAKPIRAVVRARTVLPTGDTVWSSIQVTFIVDGCYEEMFWAERRQLPAGTTVDVTDHICMRHDTFEISSDGDRAYLAMHRWLQNNIRVNSDVWAYFAPYCYLCSEPLLQPQPTGVRASIARWLRRIARRSGDEAMIDAAGSFSAFIGVAPP